MDLKLKGGGGKGDIRTIQYKKHFECWAKTRQDIPEGAQESIQQSLPVTHGNQGKDEYTVFEVVDLAGHEKQYWLGTESGLLGSFNFDGACTTGDGSCDRSTGSIGARFCNFRTFN